MLGAARNGLHITFWLEVTAERLQAPLNLQIKLFNLDPSFVGFCQIIVLFVPYFVYFLSSLAPSLAPYVHV